MDRREHQGQAAAEVKMCPTALLPDDVLADVLRRVPPRGLAACRCVCKAWLAVVDANRLLRADLLPLSLGGLFLNFHNYYISEFFAPRPVSDTDGTSIISGKHKYFPDDAQIVSWGEVDDHCNGLVLVHGYGDNGKVDYVLNPATRWLAPLPPCPPLPMEIKCTFQSMYLAYDPAQSPYYEVVAVTRFHWNREPGDFLYDSSRDAMDPEIEQSEWPPSVWILNVFSSRTGQWGQRSFAREGDPIGTVSSVRRDCRSSRRNAAYWRGALYVHCKTKCVLRISLLSGKYHVIKPPLGTEVERGPRFYLGKSSKGVYCASIKKRCRVQVWNLIESSVCQMEWVLMHDRDLSKWLLKHKLEHPRPHTKYGKKNQAPWALQDINNYYYSYYDGDGDDDDDDDNDDDGGGGGGAGNRDEDMKEPAEEKTEWSDQDEKFTWSSEDEYGDYHGYINILGFHPCKEIVFLSESIKRGLAYHFNSSKVEVLGTIYPAGYGLELLNEQFLESSFAYTPCWLTQTTDENC